MQPAKEERAEGAAVVALRAEIEQQKQGCQHEAGDDSIAQRSKDLSHFHSPRRISPTRREVLCGSADFTLRRLDESGPECRSEEHTSELQSLMRNSYAVFCLKKKKRNDTIRIQIARKTEHTEIMADKNDNTEENTIHY